MKQNGFEFANESKSLNDVIDEVKNLLCLQARR